MGGFFIWLVIYSNLRRSLNPSPLQGNSFRKKSRERVVVVIDLRYFFPPAPLHRGGLGNTKHGVFG